MDTTKQAILDLIPKQCPSCGGPLKLNETMEHLTCQNSNCQGKFYRRLEIMAKAFGIENIGLKVAEELTEYLNLTDLSQIYDKTTEDFLKVPRYKTGMATKLYNSIQSTKQIPFNKFIQGIQIDRIGEGTSVEISKAFTSIEQFINADKSLLSTKLTKWGPDTITAIHTSITKQKQEILNLLTKITIQYPETAANNNNNNHNNTTTTTTTQTSERPQITAVVTGSLDFGNRKKFQETYGDSYNVKWGSGVSSNTDYLVINNPSSSSKYKDAKKHQANGSKIQIVTEQEFITLLTK